jgi:hypothetical protein
VTRLVSLAFVGYAAYALLGIAGWTGGSGVPGDGFASSDATSEACEARRAGSCFAGTGARVSSGDSGGDAFASTKIPRVVSLALPDPDPESGRSRVYSANHWFHVCEFHFHNHARLRQAKAFLSRSFHRGEASASKGNPLFTPAGSLSKSGTARSVIVVVPNDEWLNKLTPMTRLLLAASYTDGKSDDVYFAAPRETFMKTLPPSQASEVSSFLTTDDTRSRLRLKANVVETDVVGLRCGWRERAWRVSRWQNAFERFAENAHFGSGLKGDARPDAERSSCEPTVGEALASSPLAGDARMGRVKAERGDWLPRDEDVVSMRDALAGLCEEPNRLDKSWTDTSRRSDAADAAAAALASQPCGGAFGDSDEAHVRHLVIYQRNTGRVMEDVRDVATKLEDTLNTLDDDAGHDVGASNDGSHDGSIRRFVWRVSVVTHSDSFPPCALRSCLARASALVTPHGFQSMLYLFLPKNAHVHEVFPHRYYKHGYKRAALEWGVSYGFSMSPPRSLLSRLISRLFTTDACMRMYYCRFLARKGDVLVTDADAALIARSAVVAARASAEAEKGLQSADEKAFATGRKREETKTFAETRWHTRSEDSSRAECLAACAGEHGCQFFALENAARCALRTDDAQGEKDGDVLGAGIYNNKCYVPGCRKR